MKKLIITIALLLFPALCFAASGQITCGTVAKIIVPPGITGKITFELVPPITGVTVFLDDNPNITTTNAGVPNLSPSTFTAWQSDGIEGNAWYCVTSSSTQAVSWRVK